MSQPFHGCTETRVEEKEQNSLNLSETLIVLMANLMWISTGNPSFKIYKTNFKTDLHHVKTCQFVFSQCDLRI